MRVQLAFWGLYTAVYAAGVAFVVWIVLDGWEPSDGGPGAKVTAVLIVVGVASVLFLIGVLPFWLRLAHPLAHGVAAVLLLVAAFAVTAATWGIAFVNGALLLGLAAANAYVALRFAFRRTGTVVAMLALGFAALALISIASIPIAAIVAVIVVSVVYRQATTR